MRRIGLGIAGVLAVLLVGGAVALGMRSGARQDAPTLRSRAPTSDPERRVTRFGPGDPRAGSRPEAPGDPAPEPRISGPRVDGPPKQGARLGEPTSADTDVEAREGDPYPVDAEGIRDAIGAQRTELKACYDTLLASYPDVAGRIEASFEIGPDGAVRSVDVLDATFDSVYLEGCIVTALEDVRFEPAADGGSASVTWPFVFSTAE